MLKKKNPENTSLHHSHRDGSVPMTASWNLSGFSYLGNLTVSKELISKALSCPLSWWAGVITPLSITEGKPR